MTNQCLLLFTILLTLANCSWAQHVLTVELLSYNTNWNERFPCPGGSVCSARYQYCLRPFGSTGSTRCNDRFRDFPRVVPSEMADNFTFNHTEMFIQSTIGPIQFYLEAEIDVSSLGRVVVERFPIDVDTQLSSNYTEASQLGLQNIPNIGPPGIITIRVGAECEENLFGPSCDIQCAPRDDASGHYTCNDQGNRVCLPGYCEEVGNSCRQECNECADNPCLNGGDCSDLFDGFNCSCLLGFTGAVCETDINNETATTELLMSATEEGGGTESPTSFFLSPLVIGVAIGAAVLVLTFVLSLSLLVVGLVRMRRKMRRAREEKPDAVMVVPHELSATIKPPKIHFYGNPLLMSEEKGDRASYVSMYSPQAYNRGEEEEEEHVYEPIPDIEESKEIIHEQQDKDTNVPRESTI